MKIAKAHLDNLFDYYTTVGNDKATLLNDFRFIEDENASAFGVIDEKNFLSFLKHLIQDSNDQYFGLNYGCFLNLKSLGLVLEISLNAAKIEQAIYFLKEYMKATFPMVEIVCFEEGDDYIVQLKSRVAETELKRHLLDSVYCVMYRELKLMIDVDDYPRLTLPYPNRGVYQDSLGVDIIDGKNDWCFYLDKKLLHKEINKRRLKQIEYLLPKFLLELEKLEKFDNVTSQVKKTMLNLCAPELPNISQVLSQFSVSKRTLQRQLLKEGTSFREISNELKKKLATFLEKGEVFKTYEIASILGYSESSAFIHAKNSW